MGQAGVWSQLFAAMGEDFSTVELPGHGDAPDWDPSQDYQSQAQDLVLARLVRPAHLVGHSYGATVALRVAIERPDLVRSLTLIEPVFFKAALATDPAAAAIYVDEFAAFRNAMDDGDLTKAARVFAAYWGGIPWDALRPEQQNYMIDRMPLIEAAEPSIVEDNANLWPRLRHFEKPVLLLDGGRSPKIISTIQNGLMAELPNATREIIDRAGHMGPITHPRPFAESILAFQQRN